MSFLASGRAISRNPMKTDRIGGFLKFSQVEENLIRNYSITRLLALTTIEC